MSTLLPDSGDVTARSTIASAVSVIELSGSSHAPLDDQSPTNDPYPVADRLHRRFGPVLGVGDLIWRAVFRASTEIVCVLDGRQRQPESVDRLVAPLFDDPGVMLVNGSYDCAGTTDPRAGDRLTEIVARPLMRRWEPALSELEQPLFYEFAARRSLLCELAFPVGPGVHLSLPIDVVRQHGSGAIDEVRLDRSRIDDRPLRALGADACAVISAMRRRIVSADATIVERFVKPWDDLAVTYIETAERPPLTRLSAADSWPSSR